MNPRESAKRTRHEAKAIQFKATLLCDKAANERQKAILLEYADKKKPASVPIKARRKKAGSHA